MSSPSRIPDFPRPESVRRADVLREESERERRLLAEGGVTNAPVQELRIDLATFVRDTFDGLIGDCALPFPTQDDARLAVECALTDRARRALTKSELVKVGLAVALEWNRRR